MHATHRDRLAPAHRAVHARRARAARYLLALLLAAAGVAAVSTRKAGAQEPEKIVVLTEATEGVNYSVALVPTIKDKDGKDVAAYTWRIVTSAETPPPPGLTLSNALPPGLDMKFPGDASKTTGKLEGVPTAPRAEPYLFRVRLDGPTGSRTLLLSLEVGQFLPFGARLIPTPTPVVAAAATPVPTPFITTSTNDEETIALAQTYTAAAPDAFKPKDIDNEKVIHDMIVNTIGNSRGDGNSKGDFRVGDYCAVDVIKWRPLVDKKTDPQREIWALFKAVAVAQDDTHVDWVSQPDPTNKDVFATRIYGSKRVAILLVHFNTPLTWDVEYKASINQKIPTPIQNVLALARSILPTGGGAEKAAETKNIWGARMMFVKYESSELVVKLNAVTSNADGQPVEQSKEHTNTFVNEKRYRWDVSVGLPVQSVRELQFKSDGNRVFAESKEKQSVYGFLNIYPFKAVDLKSDKEPTWPPHLLFGVPLASKPLQRPFAGVGIGVFKTPIKFNIFGGIVFIRERVPRTLGEGSAATTGQLDADLHTRWVRKGMFGINVPISQIKDAIKGKSQ